LKQTVEALIRDEREVIPQPELIMKDNRDYLIRYVDLDNEYINVSDEEDLQTAYEVAEKDLDGSLKFIIEFRKPFVHESSKIETGRKKDKKEKKEKKEKKKAKKKVKKALARGIDHLVKKCAKGDCCLVACC
jgi:uncharacterized protein YueI